MWWMNIYLCCIAMWTCVKTCWGRGCICTICIRHWREALIKYSIEAAMEETLKGLQPLGRTIWLSYGKHLTIVGSTGLRMRKRSGAYSSVPTTRIVYLMNWQDSLNQLYTLVHELGHSVHNYLTRKNQPYVYGDYSIFLAEIASTTNENILTDYLLKTQTDPKVRIYILNHYLDGFKERYSANPICRIWYYIHQKALEGVPLTQDFMTSYYAGLNAKYYGPSVEKDPEIGIEWTRIRISTIIITSTNTLPAFRLRRPKRIVEGEEGALKVPDLSESGKQRRYRLSYEKKQAWTWLSQLTSRMLWKCSRNVWMNSNNWLQRNRLNQMSPSNNSLH